MKVREIAVQKLTHIPEGLPGGEAYKTFCSPNAVAAYPGSLARFDFIC